MAGINTTNGGRNLINHPDECPFCHNKITPINIYGFNNESTFDAFVVCPNSKCKKTFIAYYNHANNPSFLNIVSQGNLIGKEFNEVIEKISTSFITIYNQSFSAEQQNLTEICGVGYRKALEFLIKDYIIYNDPTLTEKVEKKLLGACINEYVNDEKIKAVSKRAAWLGNDETHYVRKWEGKNLMDLKKLIDLTVHWIEMEDLTKSFEEEMPE